MGLLGPLREPLREPGPGFTDSFLHACYPSSGGSPAVPRKRLCGYVSIRGPPRLRGHSPPFLMEAASRVAASPPTGKQPQRKRERARKGQAWEAHGVRTAGIWSRGGGGGSG